MAEHRSRPGGLTELPDYGVHNDKVPRSGVPFGTRPGLPVPILGVMMAMKLSQDKIVLVVVGFLDRTIIGSVLKELKLHHTFMPKPTGSDLADPTPTSGTLGVLQRLELSLRDPDGGDLRIWSLRLRTSGWLRSGCRTSVSGCGSIFLRRHRS